MATIKDTIHSAWWGPPMPLYERGRFATSDGGSDRNQQALRTQQERALSDQLDVEAGYPVDADSGDSAHLPYLLENDNETLDDAQACGNTECKRVLRQTPIGDGQGQCPACGHIDKMRDPVSSDIADAYRAPLPSKQQGIADAARSIQNAKVARAASVAAMTDTTSYTCPHCSHSFPLRDEARCRHCGTGIDTRGLREGLPPVVVRR